MNLKDKLELALHEAYIKAYKLAEPSADFDILVEKCRNYVRWQEEHSF